MPLIKKQIAYDYQSLFMKEAKKTLEYFEQKLKAGEPFSEAEINEGVNDIREKLVAIQKLT